MLDVRQTLNFRGWTRDKHTKSSDRYPAALSGANILEDEWETVKKGGLGKN